MAWNDEYRDEHGNVLNESNGDQKVYDRDGNYVGEFHSGYVHDVHGNTKAGFMDDNKSSSTSKTSKRGFFGFGGY